MNQKQKEYKREYFARRYKELYKPELRRLS